MKIQVRQQPTVAAGEYVAKVAKVSEPFVRLANPKNPQSKDRVSIRITYYLPELRAEVSEAVNLPWRDEVSVRNPDGSPRELTPELLARGLGDVVAPVPGQTILPIFWRRAKVLGAIYQEGGQDVIDTSRMVGKWCKVRVEPFIGNLGPIPQVVDVWVDEEALRYGQAAQQSSQMEQSGQVSQLVEWVKRTIKAAMPFEDRDKFAELITAARQKAAGGKKLDEMNPYEVVAFYDYLSEQVAQLPEIPSHLLPDADLRLDDAEEVPF
jgi:hypothetical protein